MAIEVFNGILQIIFRILAASWWAILPLILLPVFLDFWLMAIRFKYILKIKWVLLEIKIPREILKTPKAMELVFAAVYSMHDSKKFVDIWWKGEVQFWATFEMTGHAGGIRFYARIPAQFRNMIESAIYSQYPDIEIIEAEDYVDLLPAVLPNKTYDLWGNNFILAKPNAYPIQTYPFFEDITKEKRLDPLAVIMEALSKTKEDEMSWLQLLVRPVDNSWKKEGEELVSKLIGRKTKKERTILEDLGVFLGNLIKAPFTPPVWPDGEQKEGPATNLGSLTPGERDVVAAVENKISKLGFESILRFVYIDKADAFTKSNVSSVFGAMRQFTTQHLNGFKFHSPTTTKADPPFKARKTYLRKRRIYDSYRWRFFPFFLKNNKLPILNTEELATIYHFPTTFVEAPTLKHLDSKRGEPPAELPIIQ